MQIAAILVVFVNCLDLCGQIRQVFIQETIVVVCVCIDRLLYSHLRLQVHLHGLELLHLLSQLAETSLVSAHSHHLLLLLQKKHLLLHHVHLHLNCVSI